nr:tetratricopeptide repeat protein [Sphingomonadaceae bacterium]
VLGGGGALFAWRRGLFGGAMADSIAVLPFKNLSGDPAQAYFSEGLTEEVRAALSRNDALQVLAATSSNAASAHGEDAVSIASRLGVAYLLEGSIQRSNDIVRISADLTDGKTGFSRWSNTVDRKMTDIFALQNAIARMVAEALSVQMATAAPAPGGTTNVPAYEAFLRGRALFNAARDEATDRAALAQYDVAITLDGNFAMAHAARSRSLAAIAAEYAKAEELHPLYDAAIAAAQRAIALAPDLAEGHLALGYALFTGRLDVEGARPSYDRAYALGHGNADILVLFALYCSRAKRGDDARAAILRAIALDPLNPRTYRAAGSIDYAARRYAAAIAPLDRALALNPEISNAHALIGNCLLLLGRLDEARAAYAAEPHALFQLSGLAIVEQRRGDKVAAKKYMDRLIAELGDSALYQQAEVLAQWGQADAALATLERARAIGDSGLIYLSTDPMLDPLRRQPRFARLLNAMRLG